MKDNLPHMRPALRPPGLNAPWHTATTAHLACLYPWHQGLDLGPRGVLLGRDGFTGAPFFFDPFDLYARRLVSNPNMLILGDLGRGKSTTVKCLVHRLVGGLRDRWVAILDPKREYGPLADALGLQLIRLQPGGTTRLNPLDAGPAADRLGADELLARRVGLLVALLGSVIGRDLTPLEDAACGWAADELTRSERAEPNPTLRDVHRLLGRPTPTMATRAQLDPSTLAQRLGDLRLAAEALLERDLRGMFDGASTVRTDLGGRGLVVDLSAVFGNPRLLTPVMVCVTGWLQAVMARPVGEPSATRRIQVIDEAWALLANERTARYLQASWRLSRQWGVANIAVTHTVEDLMAQADDGTAVVKVARGLVQTTDTIVHHYAKRCGQEATDLLGLSPSEAAAIPTLRPGHALWRVAGRSTIVAFRVANGEQHITDTDQAMEGR